MPEWLQIIFLVSVTTLCLISAYRSVRVLICTFKRKKKKLPQDDAPDSLPKLLDFVTKSLSNQIINLSEVDNNENTEN